MTSHPLADLSAYLDGALDPAARAPVQAHLDACPACRARLADLRAVSRAIGALPDPVPTRSLVPRLARRPAWLAPVRTLATLASGVFTFAFLISFVLVIDPSMGGGGRGALVAPRDLATSATTAPSAFGAAPAVVPQALPAPSPRTAQESAQADTAKQVGPARPTAGAGRDEEPREAAARPALGPSPLLWLARALGSAGIALLLRRRMRSV